jgi:integrase/recombinase XerD
MIKLIDAQREILAGVSNTAILSLDCDFLVRRSELITVRTDDLKFTPDGALKGMINKSKTDQYGKGRFVFDSERSAKLISKCLRKYSPSYALLIMGNVRAKPSAGVT